MNTPDIKTVRYALIALAIALAVSEVRATEIGTGLTDRSTGASLAEIATADFSIDASPAALLDADDVQTSEEAAGTVDGGESESDPLSIGNLALWLPAAAKLPYGDVALVDTFVMAVAALHSSDAANVVCDTLWELQDLEGSTHALDTRPLDIDLRERDSFAAAEVAFVLGNIDAPEPDVIFLAFVVLQSLWGLASRPRQT